MITKDAVSSEDACDHMERARLALDSARRDGLNDADVLRNPHVQAAHLKIAREEINKALAIIERMILDRREPSLPASFLRRLCSGSL
jgi:hypothetical protein